MGNPCYLVNGVTTILLDQRLAHIQQRVYDAIALGLENSSLIKGFAPGVVRAEFQRSLGESLIPNPSSDLEDSASAVPVAATILVAAASVSVILGSMFWYSLMRRDRHQHPDPNIRYKSRGYVARSLMVVHGLGLDPHRIHRRFSRLNDFSHDSDVANMNAFKNDTDDPGQIDHDATPSIIWSVSDITSDSGSVLSCTSFTGSRLERIDEEGDENADESDENLERKCLSRQRHEHVLGVQHDRLVQDEHSAIDAELVALVPMDISSLDNDLEEELEGYRFIRDEIISECIEGCPSRTVNDDDLEIRVEMMDEDVSIYSSLSSSDDDDNFHRASPEIQNESQMKALGSVAGGVQVTTVKGSDNLSSFDQIELLGYDDCAEHQPLSQILCDYRHSSHSVPMTNPGGEGKDRRCVRSMDAFVAKKKVVDVLVTQFQNPLMDKTQDVAKDSLERSVAVSIAAMPMGLPQVFVTMVQDPLEDRQSSAASDSFDLSPAGSSLGGGVRIQPNKTLGGFRAAKSTY